MPFVKLKNFKLSKPRSVVLYTHRNLSQKIGIHAHYKSSKSKAISRFPAKIPRRFLAVCARLANVYTYISTSCFRPEVGLVQRRAEKANITLLLQPRVAVLLQAFSSAAHGYYYKGEIADLVFRVAELCAQSI